MTKLTDKEILDFVRENLTLDKEVNTNVVLLDEVRCTIRGDVIGDVWGDVEGNVLGDVAGNVRGNVNGKIKMTKDQALKLALEHLYIQKQFGLPHRFKPSSSVLDRDIAAIKEALAQPEQEPFAPDWVNYRQGKIDGARDKGEWVGLTGEEKALVASVSSDVHDAVHRTNAKLKEKNYD